MNKNTRIAHNNFGEARNAAKVAKRQARKALEELMTTYAFEIAEYIVETTGATDDDLDGLKGTLLNLMSHTQDRFKEFNAS
jgi:hypothetical protein